MATDVLPEVEQTSAEIRERGRRSLAIPTDVRQTEQVDAMVEATVAEFGKVDILVSNAGIDIKKPLILVDGGSPLRMRAGAFTRPSWRRVGGDARHHLIRYVRCAIAVPPHIEQRGGSSPGGRGWRRIGTIYAASKAGVHQFSRALSREWSPFNITVNCIAPGAFGPTESWYVPSWNISREEHEESFRRVIRSVPLKRFGDPRELGMLTVFLAPSAALSGRSGAASAPTGGNQETRNVPVIHGILRCTGWSPREALRHALRAVQRGARAWATSWPVKARGQSRRSLANLRRDDAYKPTQADELLFAGGL